MPGLYRLFDAIFHGRRNQSVHIGCLPMLELWYRNFLEARRFDNDQAQAALGERV
jgi:hypothetical protein